MKVVKIQFHNLDKEYFFLPEFTDDKGADVNVGDLVIVKTILGEDLGTISDWAEFEPSTSQEKTDDNVDTKNVSIEQKSISDVKPMLRRATDDDLKKLSQQQQQNIKYLHDCKELIKKYGLNEMKLIDVNESFDGARLTFYFTADTRVDFRDLVKELVKNYRKKIRLQQVGVRDAAKTSGDFGPCGLPLCCRAWLADVGNVSPDYIKDQDLGHRGVDRLSGPCGRLKCCLRFEEEAYKYNLDKLPKVGDIIKTAAGPGKVKTVRPLQHTVELEIDGVTVEYPYLEGKLCEKNKDDCQQ